MTLEECTYAKLIAGVASYERLVTQMIAKFDARSMDRMKSILGWIAFAKRPLRKTELRSALMYGLEGHPSELVPSFIFDMCKPLVEERRNSSFVFIHVSVNILAPFLALSVVSPEQGCALGVVLGDFCLEPSTPEITPLAHLLPVRQSLIGSY